MLKKTALAALLGFAAVLAAPVHAFTITSGDYKIIVDGYVNGTVYNGGAFTTCGGTAATAANVASCNSAPILQGSVGSPAGSSEDSWGILSVASITNTTTNALMFSRGVDGYLIGAITGITDFYVNVFDTLQVDRAIGGSISLYTSATNYDPTVPSTNQAAVVASVTQLPLYLSLDFVAGAATGSAGLVATYASTFDSSTNTGAGSGYLSVTGGTAASLFDTNSLTTTAGNSADARFSVTLSPITANDAGLGNWLAGSSSDVKGTVVPEPGSLALAAIALLGLGFSTRRRTK